MLPSGWVKGILDRAAACYPKRQSQSIFTLVDFCMRLASLCWIFRPPVKTGVKPAHFIPPELDDYWRFRGTKYHVFPLRAPVAVRPYSSRGLEYATQVINNPSVLFCSRELSLESKYYYAVLLCIKQAAKLA